MTERRRERGFRGEKTNSDEATKMTEGFFRDQQTFSTQQFFRYHIAAAAAAADSKKSSIRGFDKRGFRAKK